MEVFSVQDNMAQLNILIAKRAFRFPAVFAHSSFAFFLCQSYDWVHVLVYSHITWTVVYYCTWNIYIFFLFISMSLFHFISLGCTATGVSTLGFCGPIRFPRLCATLSSNNYLTLEQMESIPIVTSGKSCINIAKNIYIYKLGNWPAFTTRIEFK